MVASIKALKGNGSLSEFIDKNASNKTKTKPGENITKPGNAA
jgi:hypothetical protein